MSRRRPAASASAVRWRSSGDGVGSPEGWLWTRIDAGRVQPDGVPEQLADPDERRRHVALVDRRDAEDDVLRVEEHDPQLLALEAAHLEHEPVRDVARRADRPARRRPVGEQPPAELERGRQLGRLRRADPRHGLELDVRRAGEPGQAVVPGERVLGEVHGRPPAPTRSPRAARSAPRRCSPAAPRSASRSRGRSAAGISRIARPRSSRPDLDDRVPPSFAPAARRHGSPRARTTEARRFLPPSGPGNATVTATGGPSPGDQPGAYLRLPAGDRGPDGRRSVARSARTRRIALNADVQPDRRPDRAAPDEASRGEGDRQPRRRTRRRSRPATSPRLSPPTVEDVGQGEEQRRPDDRPLGPDRCAARPSSRSRGTGSPRRSARSRRRRSAGASRPPIVPVGGSGLAGVDRDQDGTRTAARIDGHDDHRHARARRRTRGRGRPAGRTAAAHLGPRQGARADDRQADDADEDRRGQRAR